MSRLIDADRLLEETHLIIQIADDSKGMPHEQYATVVFADDIEDAPTVDAVPVVHGHWIDNETSYADHVTQTCVCSVCGLRSVRPLGDFCRWCGVKMDESTMGQLKEVEE